PCPVLTSLSGQCGQRLCQRVSSCQPGFTTETFTLTVPRDSVAARRALGRVSFVDCGESHPAAFLPDDRRFKVSRDGTVSATRPLQLQQREITFTVHTWDATGKKHSAKVTLRRRRHQRRHHKQMQQVKHRATPWGHSSPCPWCRGLSRVLALSRATVPTGHSTRRADLPGAWTWLPAAEEGLANGQPVEDPMEIIITVTDQNDNRPVFTQQVFVGYIEENAKPGTSVMTVNATDADDAVNVNNGIIGYSILSEEPKGAQQMFTINAEKGIISVIGTGLDRETTPNYTLIIQAADQEGTGLTNTATAIIKVTDANDNPPIFNPTMYEDSVDENEVGALVARLHVTDQDLPGSPAWHAVYRIQSGDPQGDFEITTDPKTNDGLLKTARGLDYETQKRYTLVVSVENQVPFTVSLSPATASVLVLVRDVNEAPIFIPPVKRVEVMEDVPVGYQVTSYTAQDPDKDQSQKITYRMGSDPAGWLAIDPENGIVTAAQPLDRESAHAINSTYKAIILAVDNGSPHDATGTGTLLLVLQDVNDNGPVPEPRSFDICNRQPEEQMLKIIDKDLPPNTYPFKAELMHGSSSNWSVELQNPDLVKLRMKRELEPGEYSIFLKLLDGQNKEQITPVRAQVCSCEGPAKNCERRAFVSGGMGVPAILGILGGILALL
ncbi:CADH1 protein, partial [Brachypodius atriceps]|nr:CADH1 protein [Brachypodius atriceps]